MFRSLISSASNSLTVAARLRSFQSFLSINEHESKVVVRFSLQQRRRPSSVLSSFNSFSLNAFNRSLSSSSSPLLAGSRSTVSSTAPSVLEPLPVSETTAKPSDPLVDRVLKADPDVNNLPPYNPNESEMERVLRWTRLLQLLQGSPQHEERAGRVAIVIFAVVMFVVFPYFKEAKIEEMLKVQEAKNAETDDLDEDDLDEAKALKEEQQQNAKSYFQFFSSKPSAVGLLPPVSNDMFGRPMRTVVLALHDVILHAEWRRMEGWRFQKRPHLDEFLQRISESGYEVVLWCDKPATEVEQLLQDLDPALRMKHRLFDDSMTREYFALKKDPTLLNREFRRMLVVDYKQDGYHNALDNVLKLTRFEGDVHDDGLLKLAEILEKIQKFNVYDVSSKISAFNHQPHSWRNLFEQEEEDERATMALKGGPADERKKAAASSVFGGILSNVHKPAQQLPNSNPYQRI